ncbi:MAG: penicillin-binding protein 2 [Candidatus Latescibacterota bacterium]|nr:penicillin-binding protein 2 [Candidatus Latescibacterota bacterium]
MDSSQRQNQRPNINGLFGIVALLFLILILRLFYLQITTSDDYARKSENNRITQKRMKAPRGLIVDRSGRILARNRPFYTVSLVRTSRKDYETTRQAFIEETGDTITDGAYTRRYRTIRLKRDVDFRTVSIVEERLKDAWPLLDIEIEAQRHYPFRESASHLLGYMGIIRDEDRRSATDKAYMAGDFIGKTGLEKVYENELRGRDGVRYYEVDAGGRTRQEFTERDQLAEPGRELRLTIDMDLQLAAERALPDSLAGAAVALDAQTGAVLAMANKPTFDPNVFVSFQAQKERQKVLQSETTLLNRAIRGRYPPGSTLKMIGAIAAVETGITDTLSTFAACVGSLQVGDVVFRCNNRSGHGELNLLEAIETSCNTYFHHLAQLMGIEIWREYAEKFGLGRRTGLVFEPGEYEGLLPSRQYYQERDGWTLGHLLNLIIGQGAMLATPIQMARYTAAIANGGNLVTPHLSGLSPPRQRIDGISESTLDIIRKAMHQVVYGPQGTGWRLAIDDIEVAGKSGTAQVPNRENNSNDAWFVAFAPYRNPEIAVAVVVEGGGGGGSIAAPVAREIIDAFHTKRVHSKKIESRVDSTASHSLSQR